MNFEWKNEWTVPSVVGVVSFGVGVGVGYAIRVYREQRLVRSFDQIMEEVESNKNQSQTNINDHDSENVIMIEEDYDHLDVFIDRSEHPSVKEFIPEPLSALEAKLEREPEVSSIFPNPLDEDGWNYEEEMAQRAPDIPYIIHRDEFADVTDDDGISYSKSTLTYYKGDDILVDDQDVPIYNYEKVASPLTFGKGSQDPSIVYIRNERLEADYEVILDHGHYAVEVLGVEFEQSFENEKAPLPKFRQE